MDQEKRHIGVAVSGGGHRASLWGLGSLLYLIDSGLHRHVTTISSVSGGSITNAVVGQRLNFRTTTPDQFRQAVQPLVTHITTDGLFFYGSTTNRYLYLLATIAGLAISTVALVLGLMLTQVARLALDLTGACECEPAGVTPLWVAGATLAAVFLLLIVLARRYAKKHDWGLTVISGAFLAAGLVPVVAQITGTQWALPLDWWFPGLVALALVALFVGFHLFGRRSRVAQKGLDKTHFGGDALSVLKGPADQATLHVLCATELQSGLHAYLTDTFAYNNAFGISTNTDKIPLALAVQSSAALPGAFGPRRIPTTGLGFENPKNGKAPRRTAKTMTLLDGGVYDNMAEQWFVRLDRRRAEWTASHGDGTYGDLIPPVNQHIIVNASAGWEWRPMNSPLTRLSRLAREGSAFARSQSIMYNTIGKRRRAHLFDLWKAGKGTGTFVEVDQNPLRRAKNAHNQTLIALVNQLGLSEEEWDDLVTVSDEYPTVLRWIKPETARGILWHAYINTAVATALYLNGPIPTRLPALDDFAALEPDTGVTLK